MAEQPAKKRVKIAGIRAQTYAKGKTHTNLLFNDSNFTYPPPRYVRTSGKNMSYNLLLNKSHGICFLKLDFRKLVFNQPPASQPPASPLARPFPTRLVRPPAHGT